MPLLQHASPPARIAQFNSTVHKGGLYLQSSSRILSFCLFVLTILEYLEDGAGRRWKLYGATLLAVVSIAPYEVWCIFWINDRVAEVGRELGEKGRKGSGEGEKEGKGDGKGESGEKGGCGAVERELKELIGMWRRRNWGRALPALGAGIAVAVIGSPLLGS